jgi:hypothetical protein
MGNTPLQKVETTSLRFSKQYRLADDRYACPDEGEILVYLGLVFEDSRELPPPVF